MGQDSAVDVWIDAMQHQTCSDGFWELWVHVEHAPECSFHILMGRSSWQAGGSPWSEALSPSGPCSFQGTPRIQF